MKRADSDFAEHLPPEAKCWCPRLFPKIATRHHFMPGMFVLVEEVQEIYFVTSRVGIGLWIRGERRSDVIARQCNR
jgi:hypothetical protein